MCDGETKRFVDSNFIKGLRIALGVEAVTVLIMGRNDRDVMNTEKSGGLLGPLYVSLLGSLQID